MQYRSWNFVVLLVISVQTVICTKEHVDINELRYFCGNQLISMMQTYCNAYYTKRAKRYVTKDCCNGLGCTIKYAIDNYCYEVKPEHAHLFATNNERNSESDELHKLTKSSADNQMKMLKDIRSHMSTSTAAWDSTPGTKPMKTNKSNQVRTRKSNSFASSPSSSYLSTLRKTLRRLLRRNNQCRCKCRPAQLIDLQPSSSGSYVGTDPIPSHHPVQSRAKGHFSFGF